MIEVKSLARRMEDLLLEHIAALSNMTLRTQCYGQSLLRNKVRGHALAECILRYVLEYGQDPLAHVSHVLLSLELAGRSPRSHEFLAKQYTRPALPAAQERAQLEQELQSYSSVYDVYLYALAGKAARTQDEVQLLTRPGLALPALYCYCRLAALPTAVTRRSLDELRPTAVLQLYARLPAYQATRWNKVIPPDLERCARSIRVHYRSTR